MTEQISPPMPRPRRESLDRERGQALQASRTIFATVGDCMREAHRIREKGSVKPSLYPGPFEVPYDVSEREEEQIRRRNALVATFTDPEGNPFAHVLGLPPREAIQLQEDLKDSNIRLRLSHYFAGLPEQQLERIRQRHQDVLDKWELRIEAPRKRNATFTEKDLSDTPPKESPIGAHTLK